MSTPKPPIARLALLTLLIGACQAPEIEPQAPELSEASAAIVGGRLEEGWDGVGALVFAFEEDEYYGAFCTGTLIDREWVLTAAHCLYDFANSGDSVDTIYFHTGNNAEPTRGTGFPREGRIYPTAQVFYHQDYQGSQFLPLSDVALVRLAVPAVETVYPLYDAEMEGREGEDLFYVGFGLADSLNETGAGIKRSTWLMLNQVQAVSFTSQGRASGVCYGDSGGPAFITLPNGQYAVAGINSSGNGEAANGGDPCYGESIQMRVDSYLSWIYWIMYGDGGCWDDPSICACDGICDPEGVCNPRDCYQDENETCSDIINCLESDNCMASGFDCYTNCYLNSTDQAMIRLDQYINCSESNCPSDRDYEECINNFCYTELLNCYDDVEPSIEGDCSSSLTCVENCNINDWDCIQFCRSGNNNNFIYDEIIDCAQNSCLMDNFDFGDECFISLCGWMLSECQNYQYCDVEWGGCYWGQVCGATPWGDTVCQDSMLKEEGERCLPHQFGSPIECGDFLICSDNGICERVCEYEECDWNNGEFCDYNAVYYEDFNYAGSWRDLGVCRCLDEDFDGVCSRDDCNDFDPNQSPEHHERCGDRIDNNCNGQIDEGCNEPCIDLDGDGYCGVNDCDDHDPSIFLGGIEYCDDGIDNDCDGVIDNGCQCYDNDSDGFCAGIDCDDFDSTAHPEQPEVCGDLRDNNCDGQIDEGCECVDEDADGSCAGLDCDDFNPARHPRAPEICGNEIDEDCDGVAADCDGVDAEGSNARAISRGCQAGPGARDLGASLWALLTLFGLLIIRERRRA